ncbi:MAG TPA: sulfatase-like hydrolase/transferase, partial [Pirellulaceae bacterium]|nr:sulfatase-like hydrolase/transferase [Pirellulaceae bacterium]
MIRVVPSIVVAIVTAVCWSVAPAEDLPHRPNVVLIMTDDQGYGDLGFHGNPLIHTPQIDTLAKESVRLKYFYVSPVCTPTRACLMTGRYNYRTRAIDTFRGRAMMDPAEITVAELLKEAGYATGIFGKWHLGDCYPMRA